MFALSRQAHNAALYSQRRAKIGKPVGTLKEALTKAVAHGGEVFIKGDDGQKGRVVKVTWPTSPEVGIVMELPEAWAQCLIAGDTPADVLNDLNAMSCLALEHLQGNDLDGCGREIKAVRDLVQELLPEGP